MRLEGEVERLHEIAEHTTVTEEVPRNQKQCPFPADEEPPQRDDRALGEHAVHGVVENVVGLGNPAVRAAPEGDGAGDVADEIDVEEQADRRDPANLLQVQDDQYCDDDLCDDVLGSVQPEGVRAFERVLLIHDFFPHGLKTAAAAAR